MFMFIPQYHEVNQVFISGTQVVVIYVYVLLVAMALFGSTTALEPPRADDEVFKDLARSDTNTFLLANDNIQDILHATTVTLFQ